MGERTARARAAGTALPLAGVAAACLLLLQAVLAPPLAMRMLASAASEWHVALCGGADRTGKPVTSHHHEACPLCQGHPASSGTLAAVTLASPAVITGSGAPSAGLGSVAPTRPFRLYRSRGPPFLG